MVAPPATPTALTDKINRDVVEILHKLEIVAKIQALRLEPMGGTTADAVKFVGEETQLWVAS